MTALEEIKKALEGVGPLKVEFTPDCDEFNAIIAPINEDYDGTFFTVIGCGDKQDKLGGFMAIAVNAMPELLSTLESLQRENEELREKTALHSADAKTAWAECEELRKKADAREDELVAMLNSADESRVGQIRRAIIAESEAKVLRDIIRDNWGGRSWKPVSNAKATIILQALASTGGEHHAE